MSYVYFVWYKIENESIDDIEVVAEGKLAEHVKKMIEDERIADESIDNLQDEIGTRTVENDSDAIKLLRLDGWSVEPRYVFGSED